MKNLRSILSATTICAAVALAFHGCAAESPWKLTSEKLDDAIRIELFANGIVRVNREKLPSAQLATALYELGLKFPQRKIALIVEEDMRDADKAIAYIKRHSAQNGLGDVVVLKPSDLNKRGFSLKDEPAAPPPPTPASTATSLAEPTPTAPASAPPAELKPTVAATPEPLVTPTPVAEPPPAPPPPSPLIIEVSKNGEYKLDGQSVSAPNLPAQLKAIGETTPGREVNIRTEPGTPFTAINSVRVASRDAGLGKISIK
ncbi:MAG: hypothetical protein LBD01_06890 [Puniceicoccales bacterium]|jgi:biopolymer transport protein ExbD|nr:hypothetical protein [Puniceicoccales bacterium]